MYLNPYKHQVWMAAAMAANHARGIQIRYLHVLPKWFRCLSTAVWEHPSCSSEHRTGNRSSYSISCSKRSTSTFGGLSERNKSSSSKLPFLKRLNQYCTGQKESSVILMHTERVLSYSRYSMTLFFTSSNVMLHANRGHDFKKIPMEQCVVLCAPSLAW